MGRRGPPPTPTPLKLLRGNPGRRPINRREPKPPAIVPAMPPHLDPRARAEWRRVIQKLAALGLVTQLDRAALAGYCSAWSRGIEAAEKLKEFGLVIKSPNGFPMPNPYLPILTKAQAEMRAFAAEFGMTPASRSRIETDTQPTERDLDAYRNRKRRAPPRA